MTHDPLCPHGSDPILAAAKNCFPCDLIAQVRADCVRIAEGAYIEIDDQVDMSNTWNVAVRTAVDYLRREL